MTCPHEQLRGRCYHPSLAPWPGNCLDGDTCPGGLGPWGAWRAGIGEAVSLYLSGFERPRRWIDYVTVIRREYPESMDAVGWLQ